VSKLLYKLSRFLVASLWKLVGKCIDIQQIVVFRIHLYTMQASLCTHQWTMDSIHLLISSHLVKLPRYLHCLSLLSSA